MDDYLAKPVRPEDIRQIIERWGSQVQPAEAISEAPATPESAPVIASRKAEVLLSRPQPPPVDMERLLDFANGDSENLRELVELYLQQTAKQIGQLTVAVGGRNADEVKRLAHSCAGASSTCGMVNISPMLRELRAPGTRRAGTKCLAARR